MDLANVRDRVLIAADLRGQLIARGWSPPDFCELANLEKPNAVSNAADAFLDAGVDSGPIIVHARPEIASADGPHDIGNKAIVAAAAALAEAALAFAHGPLPAVPQSGTGRVYRRADFSADAVRRLYQNFVNGMIDRYLANRAARAKSARRSKSCT